MISLTERQGVLLKFIEDRIAQTRVAPSHDEMKDHLGLKSKSGVNRLLVGLEDRGHIVRHKKMTRAIEILEQK